MSFYAAPIARLIEEFEKLPGIGHKTAQRPKTQCTYGKAGQGVRARKLSYNSIGLGLFRPAR